MRQPASAYNRSHDISRATTAALNCCDAWVNGVSSLMPSWTAVSSFSAFFTRLTAAAGARGAGLDGAAEVVAVEPGFFALASAALASVSACSASTTACWAATAASAPETTSSCGSARSEPASRTSPTVTAVWVITSPYRSSAVR